MWANRYLPAVVGLLCFGVVFGVNLWFRTLPLASLPHPSLRLPESVPVTMWVQVVLSAVVLLASLYVVLIKKKPDTAQKSWAYGAIGSILGYWLKG